MRALKRFLMLIMAVTLGVLALACQPAVLFRGEAYDPVEAAPQLTGTNWDGKPFRLSDQQGKVAIVFFGYTFCPDICPFTLSKMKRLYKELGDQADDVSLVFASVDPERDSVEKLAGYVPGFDERFYGVRMDREEMQAMIKGWNVTVQKSQPKDGPASKRFYYVDHTGFLFLIDRQGNLRVRHSSNPQVEDLLPDIRKLL